MVESPIQERILELRQVPVLRALPPLVLGELAEAVAIEAHPAGAVMMAEDRPVPALAWVLDGRVRWTRGGRALGEGRLGASVGLLELLARADGSAHAIASTPLLVARVAAERWFELLEDSFDLLDAVLSSVAGELCVAGRRTLGRAPSLAERVGPLAPDVDFAERVVRLRTSRPFVRAPIRALAALAQRCEVRRFARGAPLWEQGREAREVVVVLAGEVRDGRAVIGVSDTAGLVEALAGARHEATASARVPAVGLAFDVEALVDVLEDDDELALELARASADELLAVRLARGLPPDFFGGAPDRSLPRMARAVDLAERDRPGPLDLRRAAGALRRRRR